MNQRAARFVEERQLDQAAETWQQVIEGGDEDAAPIAAEQLASLRLFFQNRPAEAEPEAAPAQDEAAATGDAASAATAPGTAAATQATTAAPAQPVAQLQQEDSLNLIKLVGGPVLKRVIPVVVAAALIAIFQRRIRGLFSRSKS